jgi:hypothetical protein
VTTEEIEVPPWIYEGATVMVRQSERTASGSPDISSAKVTKVAKRYLLVEGVDVQINLAKLCSKTLGHGYFTYYFEVIDPASDRAQQLQKKYDTEKAKSEALSCARTFERYPNSDDAISALIAALGAYQEARK